MTTNFLSKDNVQLLREVLLDNEPNPNKMRELFNNSIQPFYEGEKNNHKNLMDMNKQFILYISNKKGKKEKELVTYEDIQENRIKLFENEFESKQREFETAMTKPIPEAPNFSDSRMDEPIGELDVIVKRMIAERNLDMGKFQTNSNGDSWLTPVKTSVKDQKTEENETAKRYIKIEKENLNLDNAIYNAVDLENANTNINSNNSNTNNNTNSNTRRISWSSSSDTQTIDDYGNVSLSTQELKDINTSDVFSKLKVIPQQEQIELCDLQEQIKKLSNTLEVHMDRCNSMLTLIYTTLIKISEEIKK